MATEVHTNTETTVKNNLLHQAVTHVQHRGHVGREDRARRDTRTRTYTPATGCAAITKVVGGYNLRDQVLH